MKLKDIYRRAIEIGIRNDWRGKECTDAILERAKAIG